MTKVEEVARAVREEIVRQYRDDDRGKCPAGAFFYEQEIGPYLIASAAIAAMREPSGAMKDAGAESLWPETGPSLNGQPSLCWLAMIDAALAEGECKFDYRVWKRGYMREYMRRWRAARAVDGGGG